MIEEIEHWVVTLHSPKHGEIKMYCGENEDYALSVYDAMVLDSDSNEFVSKSLESFTSTEIDIFNFLIKKDWKWYEVGNSEITEVNSNFTDLSRKEVTEIIYCAFEEYKINYKI